MCDKDTNVPNKNDFISREAVLKCVDEDGYAGEYDLGYGRHNLQFQELLKEIPAADVVEVVRCKDCIHDNSNDPICPIPWVKRMLDSYCSFGERRADNGK